MPVELVGAGFGRTGTISIQQAIEIIYKDENKHCYHFGSIITRPGHLRTWIKILSKEQEKEQVDWKSLFQDEFVATIDHPCAEYYEEILKVYPNAKVLLTHHPGGMEKWYQSKLGHQLMHDSLSRWPLKPLVRIVVPIMLRAIFPKAETKIPLDQMKRLVDLTEFNIWGEKGVHDAQHALQHYTDWYNNVRKVVPPDRLLEYDVSMGWEPLCEFLNKPVPKDVPFPKEQSHSSRKIKKFIQKAQACACFFYGILGAGVAAAAMRLL